MSTQVRYYGDKISNRIAKTPEGFLICQDVPISRTGYQEYLASELLDNPILKNKIIPVYRPATEVFDIRSLASFEGKPVTNEHPDEDVTPENYQQYSCGHVQNVHPGDGEDSNKVLADLYITDPTLIKLIEHGKREISCGYYAEEKKDDSGKIYQTRIRGNHVAVVQNGRAGNKVCIRDKNPFYGRKFGMRKRRSLSNYIDGLKYLDDDPIVDDDILEDDDELLDEDLVSEDELLDEDYVGDEDFEDDDFVDEDELLDEDYIDDDDELLDEDYVGDDDFEDEDFEDDELLDEDCIEDDDELLDEDFEDEDFEDEDFEDDDFEDDDLVEEDYVSDDEIDLTEKANTILNDARRTLRDAKRHLRRLRRSDAIILNDDDLEDEDFEDEDEVIDEDDLIGDDDELLDEDFEDDDFEDEDEVLDEDFEDEDELLDEDFEDDDELLDEDFEDDDFEDEDEVVDEDVVDGCHGDDDVELTETDEIVSDDESEAIDTDKTKALREITEASRGISDPNERKQLQDAIYKALCGKTQMSDVMRITKKNRKARMDSAASKKGTVDMAKQQAIYDSFNPHKKTSF